MEVETNMFLKILDLLNIDFSYLSEDDFGRKRMVGIVKIVFNSSPLINYVLFLWYNICLKIKLFYQINV